MDKKLVDALNVQIKEELASAYIYAAMAADMEYKNWEGAAAWFKTQAQEEVGHAFKMYGFINSRGDKAIFDAIDKPKDSYDSVQAAFEATLAHEKYITGCITKLLKLAEELGDKPAEIFLQWFVTEQVEEEANPERILETLKRLGNAPQALFMLDRELGQRQAAQQ